MFCTRFLAVIALVGLAGTPVLAQTTVPASPARPAVPAPVLKAPTAPAPVTKVPAVTGPAATSASAKLINLNTATAAELDALPEVGKARVKAILAERAKGGFKNWTDFDTRMAGTSVNAGVKAKIKDRVTF